MPTLEDVKAVLTKEKNGNELFEVVSALASEATTHKTGLSTLHSTHNKVLNELKALGYTGGELSNFVNEVKTKLESAQAAQNQLGETGRKLTEEQKRFLDLETKLSEITGKLSATEQSAQKAALALKQKTIKEAVLPKLKDRIFGADLRAEKLIADGLFTTDENGSIIFKKGDTVFDVDKGIEEYLKDPANADDLKNTQRPGMNGGAGMNGNSGAKVLARSAFEGLNPNAQHAFIKDGGRVV